MAKRKKVTVTDFGNVVKEFAVDNVTTIDWHGIEIEIRRTLPLVDVLGFVEEVVESCFTEDGDYVPEVLNFAINCSVLTRYANLTMPKDIQQRYFLIYSSDILSTVMSYINLEQYAEITGAIGNKIEFLCDADIVASRNKLNELIMKFSEMEERFGQIFEGLSSADLSNMFKATAGGNITEAGLVKAFLANKEDTGGES